ncbi:MAG: hypothetical protein Q4A29_07780 [Eubacteriales bacterium]|nr:hypothetical protein [Eubacteriales bacterium]
MSFSLMEKKSEQEKQKNQEVVVASLKKEKKSWWKKKEKPQQDKVTVSGKRITEKKPVTEEKITLNPALLNAISPMNIKVEQNHINIGENVGSVMGVVSYPVEARYGFMKNFTNLPSSIVSISFREVSEVDLTKELNHTINKNLKVASQSNNYEEQHAAEKLSENASRLYNQIVDNKEKVGFVATTIMPYASEKSELKKMIENLRAKAGQVKIAVRNLSYLQGEGFRLLSPFYDRKKSASEYLERLFPLSAFIGSYPFASGGFNDGTGYYFAKDKDGGLVILDTWKRGDDRTNSNILILGGSGVGKTTVAKRDVSVKFKQGTKVMIIDPEGEHAEMARLLGGDVIDAGGGKGKINPLHIFPKPQKVASEEEKIEDEKEQLPDLTVHLNFLITFFKIYFKGNNKKIDFDILKNILIELYQRFSITWETDIRKLKAEDFPVVKDLWDFIEDKLQTKMVEEMREKYQELSIALKDMAVGADSFVWNGKTSLEYQSKLIVFDTSNMQYFDSNKKAAQYYNILSYMWNEVVKDREEKIMIVADEAYLAVDREIPETSEALRNFMKRIRKYEGSLMLITHLVADFLSMDEENKGNTQNLLDIPSYKIFMGTDGQNLEHIKTLYSLNEAEVNLLESKKRGKALAMIGNARLSVDFQIPEYEFEYFGKGSGR